VAERTMQTGTCIKINRQDFEDWNKGPKDRPSSIASSQTLLTLTMMMIHGRTEA
jgi:hypothetical protein